MRGALDLLESERGVFAILIVVAATVLTAVGKLSTEDWLTFVKWISVTLIASKTVTTAIQSFADKGAVEIATKAAAVQGTLAEGAKE